MSIEEEIKINLNQRDINNDENDDENEVFEDALDSSENLRSENNRVPDLSESIDDINEVINLALNNEFGKALNITEKWANESLYHALGKATILFLKGILTLEREEIEKAIDALKNLQNLCNKKRKQVYSVTKVVWKPNYNNYTDEEIHAEICFAESQLEIALLTFLADQNLISLVKGAFRIRSCYQAYKECYDILNQRTNWSSEKIRLHFESGVRMGYGTFNLMVSHFPTRVMKLLEFIGFSGNRLVGFKELESSAEMVDGLRSPLAVLIMLAYHCYVEQLFGLGESDIDYAQRLLEKTLKRFPRSAFFLLFAGRINQLKARLNEAIINFNNCIKAQSEWKQIHNICYWELLWCHCIKCDWHTSAKYADILRKQCNWSRATYTYQYATFLYMISEYENKPELKVEATKIMATVPSLRYRYAGKTIPAEKFAISMSEKYMNQGEKLLLPAIEFLYIWNIFAMMDGSVELVEPILNLIEEKLEEHKLEKDDLEKAADNYALAIHLKGICLRLLGYPLQAEECFLDVLKLEKRVVIDKFLIPHAVMEIGLTHIKMGDYLSARNWLEKARNDYNGYLLETMVHFRVHCALKRIKAKERMIAVNMNNDKLNENNVNDDDKSSSSSSSSFENIEEKCDENFKIQIKSSTFQQMAKLFRYRSNLTEISDEYQTKL